MEYTTKRIEVTRGRVHKQEARVTSQRTKVMQALADHHPADEFQARLLVMEQSLLAMSRFLGILERDLGAEIGFQKYQVWKGIEDRRSGVRSETVEEAADRFASQATESVLAPDENVDSLDRLAKAIRPLAGR